MFNIQKKIENIFKKVIFTRKLYDSFYKGNNCWTQNETFRDKDCL